MTDLLAYYHLFLAIALIVYVLAQYLRGRDDLCSLRNVAILGFVIFQLISAWIRLATETYKPFQVSDPVGSGTIYAFYCTVFIIISLASYRWGVVAKSLAAKVPAARSVPNDTSLLAMAGVLVVMGLLLRVGVQLPLVTALADYLGTGYAAMATGLCGWVLAKRFFNPVVILYTGLIVSLAFVTVMYSSFGRRGLIAVGAGLLWGMYFSTLRKERPLTALTRLGFVAIFPVIFTALYTSVRSASEHERTAGQHLSAISRGGNLTEGMMLLFEGQNVGNEGFWLIENYPESFPYRWFFTLRYTFEVMIPRAIYPDKPLPLSNLVAAQANMQKVNQDKLKMSPGIIGSAATEGGIWAVIVYAFAAGLFLRFYDQLCILNPHTPFVVLPVASAMGQVLGFARGETSVMVNNFMLATFGCWCTMLAVGKLVEFLSGGSPPPEEFPDEDHDAEPADDDAYAPWKGYGAEAEPQAQPEPAR